MAKKSAIVKITGVEEVKKNLLKYVHDQTRDNTLLNDAGKEAVDQIRKRTQAGIEDYKQPKLSDLTIEIRKLLARNNGQGAFYNDKRSNLTFSGQLLRALTFKIDAKNSVVTLFLQEGRYKILPLSQNEAKVMYETIIDRDHNATNSQRKNPKDKVRTAAIAIASRPQKEKTNKQIRQELAENGRKFLFVSEALSSLLQSKLAQALRRRLSIYKKLRGK